ncbi:tryptophan halogenase family protein [Novosphingobium sediminicola]|uniref:Tryptophan halogenase n=1 Tax=Novosphingobium sediminicola TaxID=563162 RepID=A0A7W6CBX0_9SPHN|nr:tryptophan halogenase family protein [Novosphingobium sediminicola]MBB3953744.1 tryptophan halogenase [Novosphingobium sediminicola]
MPDFDHQSAPPGAIRSVVVAGGGTAGWMAATYLAARLEGRGIAVTVIESSTIGTIGVGEATVPAIRDFFKAIGLHDFDVLRATAGTPKLGIDFAGWAGEDTRFFHPFGLYGLPSRGVPFHHYWLKLAHAGLGRDLGDYSLCTEMARNGTFMLPVDNPVNDLAVFDWAVHFDASRFAAMLRDLGQQRGVRLIDDVITHTVRDDETGHITSLETQSGLAITGDLFIDCTGFRSLLLGEAMGSSWVDWTDMLPCDRAVALPCAASGGFDRPYTTSTARKAGWQWRIPLQHRVGNGYVYSSAHISDDEATATLRARLEGEALAEPNMIRFGAGHRREFWRGNCVGVGLAAGFLEPLESTSITLIQTALEKLVDLFPDRACAPALAGEFNRATTLEYERIRDFLILHYHANRRQGEPLWDQMRAAPLPEKLAHKLSLWRARGKLVRYEWEAFFDPSWLSMYAGFGLTPAAHDPLADYFTHAQVVEALDHMREAIRAAAAHARPARDFLARLAPQAARAAAPVGVG